MTKKPLIIIAIIAIVAFTVFFVLNFKVNNGSSSSTLSMGGTDFAGCEETHTVNVYSYDIFDVSIVYSGNIKKGKIDIFVVDGNEIKEDKSNILKQYEYSDKGDFIQTIEFDKVSGNDKKTIIVVGSNDLELGGLKVESTHKVHLYDHFFSNEIKMITPE